MSANSENSGYEEYEEYLTHLQTAEKALSSALDVLYKAGEPTRGLGYRLRVSRLQDSVMAILTRELDQKEGRSSKNGHSWEPIDNEWICVYCNTRAKPGRFGDRAVFAPDVIRRVPFFGRRWRCNG